MEKSEKKKTAKKAAKAAGTDRKKASGYSSFVSAVYDAVMEVLPPGSRSLMTFAAGEASKYETGEAAFLRNQKALYFYKVLVSNSEMFGIDPSTVILQSSIIYRDEVAISHSCYAKNLRRWMKGQLPRKRRCRAEFAALTYCWATAFGSPQQNSNEYIRCREKIKRICRRSLADPSEKELPLHELIWRASCSAYMPGSR